MCWAIPKTPSTRCLSSVIWLEDRVIARSVPPLRGARQSPTAFRKGFAANFLKYCGWVIHRDKVCERLLQYLFFRKAQYFLKDGIGVDQAALSIGDADQHAGNFDRASQKRGSIPQRACAP